MTDAEVDAENQKSARWTIRFSPWLLCGALLLGSITVIDGIAPASFLFANFGLGIAFFAFLTVTWRVRSGTLRMVALIFFIFGQEAIWHRLGGGQVFEIMQGASVMFAAAFALMFLSRRWLPKFARLEDVGGNSAEHPGDGR